MLTLISICTFATVCLWVVGMTMKGERAILRDRVETLRLSLAQDIEMVAPELTRTFGERVMRPWLGRFSGFGARLLPANAAAMIAGKLERAGMAGKMRAGEFIGLKALAFISLPGAAMAYWVLGHPKPLIGLTGVVVAALLGWCLPDLLLDRAVKERQSQIRKSLADCLDLLVVSAEAGLGFDAALTKVVDRMRGPLPDEFRRALQEMSVGKARIDALRAMSERTGIQELSTFVAALHQADLLGVGLAQVLRVQADGLRSQRNIKAREFAARLPVKLLIPLVFFIFPSIYVVILAPAAKQILSVLGSLGK